ncbi:hypothetical protein [Brevibacterium litoralis]|uniref:hypothetical protein n=1 Tax=Brevibacterium litoralis TaxID=3138935 RepID=UPI0032EB09A5
MDDYGPELAAGYQVGKTAEGFEAWTRIDEEVPPTFGRTCLDAIVRDLGLTPQEITHEKRPEYAPAGGLHSNAFDTDIAERLVIGYTDIDRITTEEGHIFVFEMTGKIYAEGEGDINVWDFTGEPDLYLSNGTVPTMMTTCTQLVNRIPDVVAARPGFVPVTELPRIRYRVRF